MADYTEISLAQATYKAGIGQDFMRQNRDNQINFNARLVQLESEVRLFDHFIDETPAGLSLLAREGALTTGEYANGGNWMYIGFDGTGPIGTDYNAAKPTWTTGRIGSIITTVGHYGIAFSKKSLRFDGVTKPITYEGRFKLSADGAGLFGMRDGPYAEAPTTDRQGIWVERVDSTNWRFVSYDTARNSGSNFSKPTAGNWFKVKIVFDTSTDRALCYIDDVLKETLTTQLPTTRILHAAFGLHGGGAATTDLDFDWVDWKAVALLEAA
jgi:hypothetical protein